MAILLEEMVFLMKSRDSAEEDEDEDVNFQRREVSNTVAAITDNIVLAEAIDDDDWDLTRGDDPLFLLTEKRKTLIPYMEPGGVEL